MTAPQPVPTDRASTAAEPLLQLRGVDKHFGAVQVLHGVDLDVYPGEVTALVGDNGAGKSTLIKGLAGIHVFDSGTYTFDGKQVHVTGPKQANALGIEVVYQDLALCDNLDIVHNLFLGRELTKGGRLDEAEMERRAKETLAGLSVRTVKSIRQQVASLSGGQRQTVAIARSVLWNSRLVILDEPTAALGVAQTEQVLKLVRRLADKGLAVVLISHNLNDVFEVADRVAVLYMGQMAAQVRLADVDRNEVVQLITSGRSGKVGLSAAEKLASAGDAKGVLMTDTTTMPDSGSSTDDLAPASRQKGLSGSIGSYVEKVRGGDVGSLPALLGLVVLVAVFSALRPTTFTNAFNFANLINQSAAVIVIAMGLVFVLLLGEIDLSAGFTAGTGGAVMGIVVTRQELPWPLAVLAGILVGVVIGTCIGLLVARLGIPSFVVTLAAFLGLQGVLLQLIGEGGSIPVRDSTLVALNNSTLPVWLGWLLVALVVAGYALTSVRIEQQRRSSGLVTAGMQVVLAKALVLGLLLVAATAYLSTERSRNPALTSIKGVPVVVVLLVVLLLVLTFLLQRTAFGRHVYAVGGNAEAARRSGIDVKRVRLTCFIICSSLATVAGLLLASRSNGVTPSTGGAETLLYAVGAAVIGGTSLFGGKGKVSDAILGGLVIAVIINGMGLLNQPAAVVFMVTGAVLLIAASVDALSRKRAAASGRV